MRQKKKKKKKKAKNKTKEDNNKQTHKTTKNNPQNPRSNHPQRQTTTTTTKKKKIHQKSEKQQYHYANYLSPYKSTYLVNNATYLVLLPFLVINRDSKEHTLANLNLDKKIKMKQTKLNKTSLSSIICSNKSENQ